MQVPDELNAAANLMGRTLNGEWRVTDRLSRDPAATGGFFSINYLVEGSAKRKAFLKVVNLAPAVADLNQLRNAVNAFVFERDLVEMCGLQGMSRVITALDSGQLVLEDYMLPEVNFIVFELAARDVRVALGQVSRLDNIFRLQMLHDMTLGLRQLHQQSVAHQDFKPSNILVVPENAGNRGKVGDLGRAFRSGVPSAVDSLVLPGDRTYAPPEQLYGYQYPDMRRRRFAADLYQLGSLACFLFTGITMNARLSLEISPELHWDTYGDEYPSVLPYIKSVYFTVISVLRNDLPATLAKPLTEMISYLCDPDADGRGHPLNRRGHQNRFALDRVVTALDLMQRREIVAMRRPA